MTSFDRLHRRLAALALVAGALVAHAGPGHDHGNESKPAAAGPGLPRFTASSELFELVGVVDGRRLTVYLDHAATNDPVKDATLELEIAGVRVVSQPHGDGEFDAELAQPLPPGVHPVIATIGTARDSDLLAGELELQAQAPDTAVAAAIDWRRIATWGGAGALALLVLAVAARAAVRRRGATPTLGSAS